MRIENLDEIHIIVNILLNYVYSIHITYTFMMLFYWGTFNLIKYSKVDGIIKMTTSSSFKLRLYARYSFAIYFLVFLSKRPNIIVGPKIFYQLFIIFSRICISGIRILRWAVHFSKTLIDYFISCTHYTYCTHGSDIWTSMQFSHLVLWLNKMEENVSHPLR